MRRCALPSLAMMPTTRLGRAQRRFVTTLRLIGTSTLSSLVDFYLGIYLCLYIYPLMFIQASVAVCIRTLSITCLH